MADDTAPNPQPTTPAGAPTPDDIAQEALAAARDAIAGLNDLTSGAASSAAAPPPAGSPLELPAFTPTTPAEPPRAIDLLSDVNLNVTIELGRTRMLVEDVLKLGEGVVVELDKLAGDPVDVYVNDRHVARGEILVLNDNFCVRINEILAPPVEGAKRSA
jgi:flagellar motor switch protein FliN/FliY